MSRKTALALTVLGLAALLALLIVVRLPAAQAQGSEAGRGVAQEVAPAAASYNGQPGYDVEVNSCRSLEHTWIAQHEDLD